MQTGNSDFIYRNKLDKACFQHYMAHGKTKHFAKRTQSDKGLRYKAFKNTSDLKLDGYQRGLASMVYIFFDKKSVKVVLLTNQIISWQMSFINRKKNSKKEKFMHHLETIFGALI